MSQAKNGDTVRVNYTGKLDNGAVFDSSDNRPPLEFTLGEGRLIRGFEEAVIGMNAGDSKTARVPSDLAFGPHHDELVQVVEKDRLPGNADPKVGDQYTVRQGGRDTVMVTVSDVSDKAVTLDANHPLAGKDLTFEIELVEIVK